MSPILQYWREKSLITEEELAIASDGLETRVDIEIGSRPMIESSDAIFTGVTGGAGLHFFFFGFDVGFVRGRDSHELKTMTFYARSKVRVWAETNDRDGFMDSAAYLDLAARRGLKVQMGGRLAHPPEGVPELKMEYLRINGPNSG